ncbi:hypothetical protein MBLNU230_g6261t1 [Neophaeotheca triangularis]
MTKTKPKPNPASANSNSIAALTASFAKLYGTNSALLEGWRDLCNDIGIPAGESITQCKKVLRSVNINIHDLVRARRDGKRPRRFPSKAALKLDLMQRPWRKFPLAAAKRNGFLTALLVEVF